MNQEISIQNQTEAHKSSNQKSNPEEFDSNFGKSTSAKDIDDMLDLGNFLIRFTKQIDLNDIQMQFCQIYDVDADEEQVEELGKR